MAAGLVFALAAVGCKGSKPDKVKKPASYADELGDGALSGKRRWSAVAIVPAAYCPADKDCSGGPADPDLEWHNYDPEPGWDRSWSTATKITNYLKQFHHGTGVIADWVNNAAVIWTAAHVVYSPNGNNNKENVPARFLDFIDGWGNRYRGVTGGVHDQYFPERGVNHSLFDFAAIIAVPDLRAAESAKFKFYNANPDYITRPSGSFISDEFRVNTWIKVTNSKDGLNNGLYQIAKVEATKLTLAAEAELTTETGGKTTSTLTEKNKCHEVPADCPRPTPTPLTGSMISNDWDKMTVNAGFDGGDSCGTAAYPVCRPYSQRHGRHRVQVRTPDETADQPELAVARWRRGVGPGNAPDEGQCDELTEAECSWDEGTPECTWDTSSNSCEYSARSPSQCFGDSGAPLYTQADAPSISGTFSFSGSGKTITRSTGSFVTDRFRQDGYVTVSGTTNNNGTYRMKSVTATTITVDDEFSLTTESGTATLKSGHELLAVDKWGDTLGCVAPEWWNNGKNCSQDWHCHSQNCVDGTCTIADPRAQMTRVTYMSNFYSQTDNRLSRTLRVRPSLQGPYDVMIKDGQRAKLRYFGLSGNGKETLEGNGMSPVPDECDAGGQAWAFGTSESGDQEEWDFTLNVKCQLQGQQVVKYDRDLYLEYDDGVTGERSLDWKVTFTIVPSNGNLHLVGDATDGSDSKRDKEINEDDAIACRKYFETRLGPEQDFNPPCPAACDMDGDGDVDVHDVVALEAYVRFGSMTIVTDANGHRHAPGLCRHTPPGSLSCAGPDWKVCYK
jgi:hypothetical protein